MNKYWQLIPFTIPALMWGDCIGDWTNGTSNSLWKDGGNWNMTGTGCGSAYPGESDSDAIARLSNGVSANIALNGFDILPLSSLQVTVPATYTISGSGRMLLLNGANIQVLNGGSLTLNVPINDPFGDSIELFVTTSGGQLVTQKGLFKIINTDLQGVGTTPGSWTNLDNSVFTIEGTLAVNPKVGDNVQFMNRSDNSDAVVTAETIQIGSGSSTEFDYHNVNIKGSPNSKAQTSVGNVVFRSATTSANPSVEKLPKVLILNEQETVSGQGSSLIAQELQGKGEIHIKNSGDVAGGATGASVALMAQPTTASTSNWVITNTSQVTGAQSQGAALEAFVDFVFADGNAVISNTGPVSDGAIGALMAVKSLVQKTGLIEVVATHPELVKDARGAVLKVLEVFFLEGGTLRIDDTMLADSIDAVGGLITGFGTVFAEASFKSDATINPRQTSPGILHIVSPTTTLNSNSVLLIDILNASGPGPGGYGQLDIQGAASLGGELKLVLDPEGKVQCQDRFIVLTASNGTTNEFADITLLQFPSMFGTDVVYDGKSVIVTLLCQNCCLPCYLGNFTQALFASVTDTNNFLIKRELQRVQKRILLEESEKQLGNFYLGPIGSVGRSDQVGSQVGFDYWSAGAVGGANYALSQGGFGGQLLYENIQSDKTHCQWGHFRVQRAHADLYGTYVPAALPELAVDGMVGGGYDWYRMERTASSHRAQGSPNGYELDALLGVEYLWTRGDAHIVPMANLQYVYVHVGDYRENRGFSYESQRARSLSTILGLWGDYTWQSIRPFTAQANLGWQREYLNHDRTIRYSCKQLCLPGAERNSLLAGINLLWQVHKRWSVEGSYDLIWNSRFSRNGFYLGVNAAF